MTNASEEREFPEVSQYVTGKDRETPDGYFWMKLADIPSLAMLAGGGTDKRALVCERCGSFVALASEHDRWHSEVSS